MAKKQQKPTVSNQQLPDGLKNDYEIVGEWPNKFEVTGLEVAYIEWSKMTAELADHLIKSGFTGIRKIEAAPL